MSESIFSDKAIMPDVSGLQDVLGESFAFYNRIVAAVEAYGEFYPEWKYYGKTAGWILKMFSKKRNILFLVPCDGYFRVSFTLGGRAIEELMSSSLPDSIKSGFRNARQYAEGKTLQIEIRTDADVDAVLQLIQIKSNK